jgi:hypothetical protein
MLCCDCGAERMRVYRCAPITEPTGETSIDAEGKVVRWHRVKNWRLLGTAASFKHAKQKFGGYPVVEAMDGALWFMAGASVADFPESQRDKDGHSSLLSITRDGAVRLYQRTPYPIELLNEQYAVGVGSEAAMAVMLCGFDARKAVEIASVVCQGCGNGIDTLALKD